MSAKPPAPQTQWTAVKGQGKGITVVSHSRNLHVFQLTESELDSLHTAGNYKTLDIALLSLCAGVFSSTLITLLTVDIRAGLAFQAFVATCGVSLIGMFFFGVRSFLAWRNARNELQRIKRGDATS